jgi:hypothetical protein
MRVRRQKHEGMDGHAVELLSLADNAEDDVGELRGRPEQQPPLKGSRSDFDEGTLRDESQRSGHTFLSVRGRGSCVCFPGKLWHHPGARSPWACASSAARRVASSRASMASKHPRRFHRPPRQADDCQRAERTKTRQVPNMRQVRSATTRCSLHVLAKNRESGIPCALAG